MEKIIFDSVTFLLFLIFICFLPGRAFLYFKKIDLSILETFTVAVILGLILFTFLNFLFGALGLGWVSYLIAFFIDGLFIFKRLRNPTGITVFLRPRWTWENMIFLVVLFLGVLSQIYLWQSLEIKVFLLSLILGLTIFTLTRRVLHEEGKAVGMTALAYLAAGLVTIL